MTEHIGLREAYEIIANGGDVTDPRLNQFSTDVENTGREILQRYDKKFLTAFVTYLQSVGCAYDVLHGNGSLVNPMLTEEFASALTFMLKFAIGIAALEEIR